MKQCITKEQWNELSPVKQAIFIIPLEEKPPQFTEEYENRKNYPSWGTVKREVDAFRPNIGQMIEFLGDAWIIRIGGMEIISQKTNNELCDLLWEAVKYKLKQ